MTKSLKHRFVSAIADGTDATLVKPSNWNDEHDFWWGVRNVTGTTDTIANSDHFTLITYNNGSGVAATLPAPTSGPPATMPSGWVCQVRNRGAGPVTWTLTGGATINGSAAPPTVQQNQSLILFSQGTNDYVGISQSDSVDPDATELPVASAATCDIGAGQGICRLINGAVTITSFGTVPNKYRVVRFASNPQVTYNSTSLILPGAASITPAAGDSWILTSDSSGNWRVRSMLNAAGRPVNTGNPDTIATGFRITPYNAGTQSSGTLTPAPYNGNYQYYTNNGAHTLAAPANDCALDLMVTNGSTAGAITFSGFTVGSNVGDALDTTNAHVFIISIRRINAVATYSIKALQ